VTIATLSVKRAIAFVYGVARDDHARAQDIAFDERNTPAWVARVTAGLRLLISVAGTASEVARSRLFSEYETVSPRLVVIAAPAGYGKSTLARQLAARFELAATCDCANVATERDLWYAILVAVRQAELASRAAATSHRADAGADPTFDNVLALVGELDGSVALVFENAETAFADPALRRSLQRLVAASPRSCTTLLCARTRARMQLSKFAAPHEMLVWRARDLAFDRDEIGRVFGGRGDGPDVVDKIAAATSGWPVAVLFLQRFVNRIGLDAALHRFGETEFEQLHEYLIEEVLAEFSSQELQAVLACSVAPDPTAEDVGNVVADVAPNALLSALTDACPLVGRIDAERFTLHPLLLAALQIRFADQRRTLGRDLARKYESQGRFVRAAQIYHTLGEVDAMARALIADNTNPERTRTIGYSALLATLDDRILAQYPILQALTIYWRRFRVDPHMLREQTEVVWETLRASASLELRANVGATIARMMYETGALRAPSRVPRACCADWKRNSAAYPKFRRPRVRRTSRARSDA